MIVFHDYDPAHPFAVTAEKHIIQDGQITLYYAPLQGSVTINGFTEDTTGALPLGTFYIDYGAEDNYRTADQKVHFPAGYNGIAVTVDYKGVSTMLSAKHMNEIREFMERGASELAARIIAKHEQNILDAHITSALREISEAIAAKGGAGGGTVELASDEEADELLDEVFPGSDIEDVGYPSVYASDKDVEEVLDEYLPMPNSGEASPPTQQDEDAAADDEN